MSTNWGHGSNSRVHFMGYSLFPCGSTCGSDLTHKYQCCQKVHKSSRKPPESNDSGGLWWRLLDSNQWPHACEYPIGKARACFPLRPALSWPDFVISMCCPLRCFRRDFFYRGSGCGSRGERRPHIAQRKSQPQGFIPFVGYPCDFFDELPLFLVCTGPTNVILSAQPEKDVIETIRLRVFTAIPCRVRRWMLSIQFHSKHLQNDQVR